MGYRFRPLAAAVALAFSAPVLAQNAAQLNAVVVRADRPQDLPAGETVAPTSLARSRAATSDTASLLLDTPGVAVYGAGGVSSLPVIHGLADDRLRIQVDGMDLIAACPNHMNPALSYIDPSQVESAKVYAGITPVSVGGDSLGNAIIVTSKRPEFANGEALLSTGEIGTFYRSNNDAFGVNLAATLASEQFSVSYRGASSQADNYKAGGNFKTSTATGRIGHTLGLDEVGSTAYETRNHQLALAYRNDRHLFEARVSQQDMPQQGYANQRMDLLDNQQTSINLRHLGQFDWGQLETRLYHEKVDHFMDFGADKRYWYGTASGGSGAINGTPCSPISATCAAGMPMYTASETLGARIKADIALNSRDLLRVGGEVQTFRLNDWWTPSGSGMWPNTFTNIKNGQRDRSALFGELETRHSAQWLTLAGLRYEQVRSDADPVTGYNSTTNGMAPMFHFQKRDADAFNALNRARTDHNWDLSALARYTVNSQYDMEFGFARKTRSPNLYERYTWSTWQMAALMNNYVGDGNGYICNPYLKPEKAHTLSATFDWHASDRQWQFKATPYYTYVTDYIDALQWNAASNSVRTALLPGQFTVLRYTNQTAQLYGIDLSGHLPLGRSRVGELTLKGLINYTHGRNQDTGDGLYNIMPLNSKLTLNQKLGAWDNAVEWLLIKGKDDVSDQRNEIATAGYSLLNLRASYQFKQARLDFGVENLFDRFYSLPLGGAYNGQGTTMSTTGASSPVWGVAVPGMGRSFYAGVNVKF